MNYVGSLVLEWKTENNKMWGYFVKSLQHNLRFPRQTLHNSIHYFEDIHDSNVHL